VFTPLCVIEPNPLETLDVGLCELDVHVMNAFSLALILILMLASVTRNGLALVPWFARH